MLILSASSAFRNEFLYKTSVLKAEAVHKLFRIIAQKKETRENIPG
jgi:hypothetical protein